MTPSDSLVFVFRALSAYRTRTALMLLAMAIGVAAVVVLTALGDGARRYVTTEFASLGSHLVVIFPGRSETKGGHPAILGNAERDLTIADAYALLRSRFIRRVAPLSVGSVPISWKSREREVAVLGTTSDFLPLRRWTMARGRFLPPGDPEAASSVCVIGMKLRNELFGPNDEMGEWIRVGERRFRIIGVLEPGGVSMGVDKDDVVIVPVASAQALFNTASLFRVFAEARGREVVDQAKEDILRIIRDRHQGEDDVTVVTQDAVLATFDKIFRALTLTVAGIAGISLLVAGILIMNVMLIAISQRTAEIGLLKALGAPEHRIRVLFLIEAAMLALTGGVIGLIVGQFGSWVIRYLYPNVPAYSPAWAVAAALGTAVVTGLFFGYLPARRAARLDPVLALSGGR